MQLRELEARACRGDPSVWPRWNPQPIDSAAVMEHWRDALARRGEPGCPAGIQVYTHFSYCVSSCNFCMYFHRVPRGLEAYEKYAEHLVQQCERYYQAFGAIDVSHAYFGGGTPTAMPAAQLARYLNAFTRTFRVRGEWSCEVHPTTVDRAKIELLARAGVNRISMGLQSLDPSVLRRITRRNRPLEELAELIADARASGMVVNTDLVLGLPEQTKDSFRADLHRVIELRPDVITVYRYQPVKKLPEKPAADMTFRRASGLKLVARAAKAGYVPLLPPKGAYASKFILPSRGVRRRIRHYARWIRARAGGERQPTPPQYAEFSYTYSHLLGLGPGAYSHLYGFAWYREVTALAEVPCTPQYYGTPLTHLDECRQEILSDLGRRRGVDLDELANRTGVDLRGRLANQLADIPELAVRGSRLRLQRDISDERETEIRKFLLPERAAVVDVDQAQASTPDHRVESELIVRPLAARYDEVALLAKFCLQMQIEKVGLRTLGARLRARDDRSLVFEVEPKPAPTLRIHIRKPGIVRGFARSRAFEITYQSRSDAPLTGAEKEFLDQLAQRMQALDDT